MIQIQNNKTLVMYNGNKIVILEFYFDHLHVLLRFHACIQGYFYFAICATKQPLQEQQQQV